MNKWFNRIADGIEWVLSRWWGFLLYCLLMLACLLYWNWDGIDRFIYITNALLVVMVLNSTRRDSMAIHLKLDDLVPPEHKEIEQDENLDEDK